MNHYDRNGGIEEGRPEPAWGSHGRIIGRGGGGGQFELGLKDVQELSNECMMEFQTEKLVCMKQREVR